MKLELLPALQTQRELYTMPRGFERFWKYIETIRGGTDDMALPIVAMNPMGHDHNAAKLDELLAFDAETVATNALAECERRLAHLEGELKVCLCVCDDARSQWTNRYATEAAFRFQPKAELRRGFATIPCWTNETWTPDAVRREVLMTVYRHAYMLRRGLPKTLGQIMRQEGLAMYFGGATQTLSPDDVDYTRIVLAPYREAKDTPTLMAALFGDEAARALGYEPLGLSPRAGFMAALAEVMTQNMKPEEVLG